MDGRGRDELYAVPAFALPDERLERLKKRFIRMIATNPQQALTARPRSYEGFICAC